MMLANIQQYYRDVERIVQYGGSRKETSIRVAFQNLLNEYAKKQHLFLVPELDYKTEKGTTVYPDGTLKDAMRLDWGYWESKDEADDLDKEIALKFAKGYPKSNILFEDSQTAVLFQEGKEVLRVAIAQPEQLDEILTAFTNYERPEVRNFREAITHVKTDLPAVSKALRTLIHDVNNAEFEKKRRFFFDLCKEVINPDITLEDINEMLIQHILTEDIFKSIYNDTQYHEENNIAQELKKLEITFFKGEVKRNMLDKIRPYYQFIQEQARSIVNHTEKKAFLNAIYEDFYKAYNPKMADKLGVVYTPQEIVQFMIDSTEYLLDKHFNLTLSDKNVEILDPATGTGTFVCALIDKIDKNALPYKYEHEIFANEVSILPYYIANLNVEYTYKQRMGTYKEFVNLCFVDTLDNISALQYAGKQTQMFGFSAENAERIKRQNSKKISVILGNPPYSAKQENFNDQNANRKYPAIDKRIKETYIKEGTAQNQIVVYDAYTRFYRWAADRLDKNGVICMITNNSFIDGRAFGGFRKSIEKEFDFAYIIDLGGDIRKLSGKDGIWLNEENTIFGVSAAVGIAMMWLVKKENKEKKPCKIHYIHPCDIRAKRQEKIDWLQSVQNFDEIDFHRVLPDAKGNWINQTDNDFDSLVPVCSKEVKRGKGGNEAIFELFSSGVKSQRDEWVYDFSKDALKNKMKFFVEVYQNTFKNKNYADKYIIKWDRELESYLNRGIEKEFEEGKIVKSIYRPFVAQWFYFDKYFNGMTYQWDSIYNTKQHNVVIAFNAVGGSKAFHCLASDQIMDLHLTGDSQCLPLYRYDSAGNRVENITDWALGLFRQTYKVSENLIGLKEADLAQPIKKTDIFHYVYAVLHAPAYRAKYEQNLKRDFPRIPLYEDFWKWATAGKALMDLHLHYETAPPYALTRQETELSNSATPKPKLKADKLLGLLQLDEVTTLAGVPPQAWAYKLGNRSALEWVLDQYKEHKPTDPTIAAKFNTYRFADYKEQVIDLLKRVCTVSVETMKIVEGL